MITLINSTIFKNSTEVPYTTLTGTYPVGAVAGSLLTAYIVRGNVGGPEVCTPPAGWSTIVNEFPNAGTYVQSQAAFYKISNGADDLTFTVTNGANHGTIIVAAWNGYNSADPISIVGAIGSDATQHGAAPSVVSAVANSVLVSNLALAFGRSGTADNTAADGLTNIAKSSTAPVSWGLTAGQSYKQLPTAGATGDVTWTDIRDDGGYWYAFNFIINPAVIDPDGGSNSFGFNFRINKPFVIDPPRTECFPISPETRYPSTITIGGTPYTVGYVSGIGAGYQDNGDIAGTARNRDDSVDPRVAGTFQCDNSARTRLRIDLPQAGSYDINMACGDATYPTNQVINIFDGSTLICTILSGNDLTGGQFMDANGIIHGNAAAWATSNTLRRLSFATTEMRIEYGSTLSGFQGISSTINHLNITPIVSDISIISINDGDPIEVGQETVESITAGFTALPNNIVTSEPGVVCSDIRGTINAPVFTISGMVHDDFYPKLDTPVIFTYTYGEGEDEETATKTTTISPRADQTTVELTSVLTTANTLASVILAQNGRTLGVGDVFYHTELIRADNDEPGILVIHPDSDYEASHTGSFDLWLWVADGDDAGKTFNYTVNINAKRITIDLTGLVANSNSPKYDALYPLGNRP